MTKRHAAVHSAALVVVVLVASLAVASCGGDGDKVSSGGGATTERTTPPSGGASDSSDAAYARSYIGMTKRAAIARAKADDRTWRIVREDDEHFPVTLDYNPERLNIEIDDGKVTKVTYG